MTREEAISVLKNSDIGQHGAFYLFEEAFECRKWIQEIPYIKFPANWQVQVLPFFALAVVRFSVKKINHDKKISVYLDCYNYLGRFTDEQGKPVPYWEIYPAADDDEDGRFAMHDIAGLLDAIKKSLKVNNEKK